VTSYTLYYMPPVEIDDQTGEERDRGWDVELLPLHLSYGSQREAEAAKALLETIYGAGNIEIDATAWPNTTWPGEGA